MFKKSIFIILAFLSITFYTYALQSSTIVYIGKVVDETTGKPIGVDLELTDSQGKKMTNKTDPTNGAFQYVIPAGANYSLLVHGPNIINRTFSIELKSTNKYAEVNEVFKVTSISEGSQLMSFTGFVQSKAELSEDGNKNLEELNAVLRQNRFFNIELIINANDLIAVQNKSKARRNKQKEAQAVASLVNDRVKLIEQAIEDWGVHQKRITIKPYYEHNSNTQNDVSIVISNVSIPTGLSR